MNIFVLDMDPRVCAEYHCDKHVVKMILEYTQLLSLGYYNQNKELYYGKANVDIRLLTYPRRAPDLKHDFYKATHWNHPCSIWVRKKYANWLWLLWTGINLCKVYKDRYKKEHACEKILLWMHGNQPAGNYTDNKDLDTSKRPLCMPEQYIEPGGAPVISYRRYYNEDKAKIARWAYSEKPYWFTGHTIEIPIPDTVVHYLYDNKFIGP